MSNLTEVEIHNRAIEQIANKIIGYYGHIGRTNGASVQYYVNQIKKEMLRGKNNED